MSSEYQILPALWIIESGNRLCYAIGEDGERKASTEYVEVDEIRRAITRQIEVLSYFSEDGEGLSDAGILALMRPEIDKADGGYACDLFPERVVAAGRAVLAASGDDTKGNAE